MRTENDVLKEKFVDTKGIIRSRISKKDSQYNGQKKRNKGTNNEWSTKHYTEN